MTSRKIEMADRFHCLTMAEVAMRIALWAGDTLPTPAEIQKRFSMSRATAYRYHDSLRSAKGLPPLSTVTEYKCARRAA